MIKDTLPEKLSDLITVALADLEAVEQDPKYKVNMLILHSIDPLGGLCSVCLAGSVLAKTCGVDIKRSFGFDTRIFEFSLKGKLKLLDGIRLGQLQFWHRVPFFLQDLYADPEWRYYKVDPEQFKSNLITLIGVLQSEGL